jgi:GTP-binding protein LepA
MKNIRNFCIIAHIDHGKSTLADRLIEITNTISDREKKNQILDSMDLEREKGITIKSQAVNMQYEKNGKIFDLNLIDTPGHVDFSYEVSRSISCCEGALLVVDAAQGIQAQTISNLYLALENNLTIIPVLNKIDLPTAMVDNVKSQIIELLGCEENEIILASAKNGIGIQEILDAVIDKIPSPKGENENPLQAMIFDSVFNSYRGIEVFFRIFNGSIKKGDKIKFLNTNVIYNADEIGILKIKQIEKNELKTGQVGYLISGIKKSSEVKVGDTITKAENPCSSPLKGFSDIKPMVFAGLYPIDNVDYENLKSSLEKLQLNDASLIWEPETSLALGFGFRCGFLGMLHMDIVQERLEREFNMNLIVTVPSVKFLLKKKNSKEEIFISAPSQMPDSGEIDDVLEPFIKAKIITKPEYIGSIMQLAIDKRGTLENQSYLTSDRVEILIKMPLVEIVFDFFDKLKSFSRGYASLDYEFIGFFSSDVCKLEILLNGEKVDALSAIIHKTKAYDFGKKICEKLKEILPKQMFDIPIQAAIGSKIIARETVKAMRKNVTAKCYGGDISRKRKLLEKQKEGKKRMRQIGTVEVPQEAFLAILKIDE